MMSLRRVAIDSFKSVRSISSCAKMRQSEPLTIPTSDGQAAVFSTKIEKLVSEISQLNLLEVTQLTTALKQRLNLPDAPIMPMGGFMAAPKKEEEDEEVAPKQVQTSFTVKLMKIDEKQKIALIKECKSLLDGMNLVQAKKFVESAPTIVKSDIPKDEAEKIKESLSKFGAELVIE